MYWNIMKTESKNSSQNCYHESRIQYDEYENEETGEIVCMDFEMCKECKAVILNDKIIGYITND